MEITKKSIQRNYKRNNDIVALGNIGESSVIQGGTSIPPLNFLPATMNEDGSYTVPAIRVNFDGSVISKKEVSAYDLGIGSDISKAIEVYDGLDSNDPAMALSAKQGMILNKKILEQSTDYDYLKNKPKINNVIITGNLTSDALGIPSMDTINAKQDKLVSGINIKTINDQSLLGEGNIKINVGTIDYNSLINKPALNGVELNTYSKLKTINNQSLLGEGNIVIQGGTGGGTDLALFAFEIEGDYLYLITDDPKIQNSFGIDEQGILYYEIN